MPLRAATTRDLPDIERLLLANQLPTVGVREAIDGFVVAVESGKIVGAIGIETCDSRYGLLRSAVVDSDSRGKGIGRDLVHRVLGDSQARRFEALYLLTTTAEKYFPAFGFSVVTRSDVPETVRQTHEFREACPASATVMMRRLKD